MDKERTSSGKKDKSLVDLYMLSMLGAMAELTIKAVERAERGEDPAEDDVDVEASIEGINKIIKALPTKIRVENLV